MTREKHPIDFAAEHLIFELNALVDSLVTYPDENESSNRDFDSLVNEQSIQTPGLKVLRDRLRQRLEAHGVWSVDEDEIELAVDSFTLAAILFSRAITAQQFDE